MTELDLIGLFVRPLEASGIPYMVTGGVASVIYGDPRFTRDVDIVLSLKGPDVERFDAVFSEDEFYTPPMEALRREAARPRHGHFNVIHRDTALRADIYLLGDDPLHAWGFDRRSPLLVGTSSISIAPIEYVILRKLEYFTKSGSDRHVRDVAMMLRISGDSANGADLDSWIERLGLREAFEAVLEFQE